MDKAAPVPRGCGSRQAGGVYLECGLSKNGLPVETFLVDPPIIEGEGGAEDWYQPHRSPVWFERAGVNHLVIWVGEEFYPNVFDFIEEVKVAGVSRRVPSSIDFSKLSADSRMIFVHPRAAVTATQALDGRPTLCPKDMGDGAVRHPSFTADTRCLGAAKYLARPTPDMGPGWVRLPCGASYQAGEGAPLDLPTRPGVFLQTPITGVAMITGHDGTVDREKEAHVRKADVQVFTSDQ